MNKQIVKIGVIATLFIVACKPETKEETPATAAKDGNLEIVFNNMIGTEALELSNLKFTNMAGNMFSVTLLKYYVSNIVLHKKDGTKKNPGNYELIDAADPASCKINLGNLTAGDYDSMSFYIGIDPTHNHTGVQDGDLDVSKGMFWTWNTGYIFFKHEGQYKNTSAQTKSLLFHYGSDNAFAKVNLPINLNINGNKTMQIRFDLNSVYSSPDTIDFNIDNNHQSTSSGDAVWMASLKSNFNDAFSFIKVD